MERVADLMQRKMEFHSSYCNSHSFAKNGVEVIKPVQMMVINGNVVCPRCEKEKNEKELQAIVQKEYQNSAKLKIYNTLYKHSLVSDETILTSTFDSYLEDGTEESTNKKVVLDAAARYKEGQIFNLILQGKQGTGKSHLAYSCLRELNEFKRPDASCLFISIETMLRLIRGTFRDKESKYTEAYFVDLLSGVDYLILDELGAETGAIETEKSASDFVQRVLYAVTTARQNKSTILTTNLSGDTLFNMYDKKVVSRLLRSPKYVIFKDSKDKRMATIPF